MVILDTDHVSLFEKNHPLVVQRVAASATGSVGISVVSIQEAMRGRLAVLNRRLTSTLRIQAYAALLKT